MNQYLFPYIPNPTIPFPPQKNELNIQQEIEKLKQEIQKRALPVKISVDGGICQTVLEDVDDADILVSSSYILQDLSNNVAILKNNIEII